jgi:hypothetical protein
VQTPKMIGRVRMPSFSSAATSVGLSWRNARRAVSSFFVSGRALATLVIRKYVLTGDTDALIIVRDDAFELHDLVELGSGAVDERGESDAIVNGDGKRELVDLIEDSATDLDDHAFGGLFGVRGYGVNAEVELDPTIRAEGVQQARCDAIRKQRISARQ